MRDRNWLEFSVGIEIDLIFVRGSKLTSFLCAGRKLLCVGVWIEIDLVLSVGIEPGLVLCASAIGGW